MGSEPRGELIDLSEAHGSTSMALETFVAEHYDRLLRLAGLVCRSVDEAEDAVQAALERAWRRRAQLTEPGLLRPWLDRIVVREAIRGRGRRLRTLAEPIGSAAPESNADEWIALRTAFGQLPPEQRAALVLHLYLGHSVAGTAQLMGVPLETARSRLRLGRSRLRVLLGEEDSR
jgi:RNA polymerase sigma-70 factor (ECF subfamily)